MTKQHQERFVWTEGVRFRKQKILPTREELAHADEILGAVSEKIARPAHQKGHKAKVVE